MDSTPVAVPSPAGITVMVLGPPTVTLTRALWDSGLRPVRGQRYGTVWALPEGKRIR